MVIYAFYERDIHHGNYTPMNLLPSVGDRSTTFYPSVETCRKAVDAFIAEYGEYYSNLSGAEWRGDELVRNGVPCGAIEPARLVE